MTFARQPKSGPRDLEVVVIGQAEVVLETDASLAEPGRFRRSQAGHGALVAVQAARLGADTALVTRVAGDAFGEWLLESWDAHGLHLDFTHESAGRNVLRFVGQRDNATETLRYRADGACLGMVPSDVDPIPWEWTRVAFSSGDFLALGPSAEEVVAHAFDCARAAGATTVFDMTLTRGDWQGDRFELARAALDRLLDKIDVVVMGAPFASGAMVSHAEAESAALALHARGVAQVVIRDGGRRAAVNEGASVRSIHAKQPLQLGSDDAFAIAAFDGALAVGIAQKRPIAVAVEQAFAVMARCLRSNRPGLERLPKGLR